MEELGDMQENLTPYYPKAQLWWKELQKGRTKPIFLNFSCDCPPLSIYIDIDIYHIYI